MAEAVEDPNPASDTQPQDTPALLALNKIVKANWEAIKEKDQEKAKNIELCEELAKSAEAIEAKNAEIDKLKAENAELEKLREENVHLHIKLRRAGANKVALINMLSNFLIEVSGDEAVAF